MSPDSHAIILVTPVWNDTDRLRSFAPHLAKALKAAELDIHWIVADDGSDASERARLVELVEEIETWYSPVELVTVRERSFKGGAIYHAWDQFPEAEWVGFVDADGAIDGETTVQLIREAITMESNGIVIGIREHSSETPVNRKGVRQLSFHFFRILVRLLTGLQCKDTQCGIKIVAGPLYRKVASTLQERGFVFDVELLALLKAHGGELRECPIPWQEVSGGRIVPWKHAWSMIGGLIRIRRRLRNSRLVSD
ncbi:MAG: glycosyltransferase [Verrucomicrobiota bacterium]